MLSVDHDQVLAIDPSTYRRWSEVLGRLGQAVMQARATEPPVSLAPGRRSRGDIAVVRLSGFISQKPNLFTLLFGGTSSAEFASTIQAAMAEPSVGSVIMDVDSPGGEVFGVPEAAAAIRAARGSKPLIALANPLMASAAYWLASQADEIVALPSSLTGSIGVVAVHFSEAKAMERMGVQVTEITHGRRKGEESGFRELTEEARDAIQARVDAYGAMFDGDVAKGRRVSVNTVRTGFGEGAVMLAQQAKAAGLIDRIGTMEDVIGDLAHGRRPSVRAEADPVELAAWESLARHS